MTKLNTYLNFAGNTEKRLTFINPFLAESLALLSASGICRWKA